MLRDLTRNALKKYLNDPTGYEKFFLDTYKLNPGIYFKLGIENDKLIIKDKLEIKPKKKKDTDEEVVIAKDIEDFFKYKDKESFIENFSKTADVGSTPTTPAISNYKAFQAFGESFILLENSKYRTFIGKI